MRTGPTPGDPISAPCAHYGNLLGRTMLAPGDLWDNWPVSGLGYALKHCLNKYTAQDLEMALYYLLASMGMATNIADRLSELWGGDDSDIDEDEEDPYWE